MVVATKSNPWLIYRTVYYLRSLVYKRHAGFLSSAVSEQFETPMRFLLGLACFLAMESNYCTAQQRISSVSSGMVCDDFGPGCCAKLRPGSTGLRPGSAIHVQQLLMFCTSSGIYAMLPLPSRVGGTALLELADMGVFGPLLNVLREQLTLPGNCTSRQEGLASWGFLRLTAVSTLRLADRHGRRKFVSGV